MGHWKSHQDNGRQEEIEEPGLSLSLSHSHSLTLLHIPTPLLSCSLPPFLSTQSKRILTNPLNVMSRWFNLSLQGGVRWREGSRIWWEWTGTWWEHRMEVYWRMKGRTGEWMGTWWEHKIEVYRRQAGSEEGVRRKCQTHVETTITWNNWCYIDIGYHDRFLGDIITRSESWIVRDRVTIQ